MEIARANGHLDRAAQQFHLPDVQQSLPPLHVAHPRLPARKQWQTPDQDGRLSRSNGRSPATGIPKSRSSSRPRSIESIREDLVDVPQSFLDQSLKTLDSFSADVKHVHHSASSLNPPYIFPSLAFYGWSRATSRGSRQNRSDGDLTGMIGVRNEWLWEENQAKYVGGGAVRTKAAKRASIEDMPFEILDMILQHLMEDISPDSYGPRNADLISCLMTSRTFHAATLSVLYKHITIPFSNTFSKMLNHIGQHPGLGTLVRRLDFSHYTSVGFGRTRRDSLEMQYLTPKTLLRCLELFTNLKEFLVHEHLDDEVDAPVLHKLFSMSSIHALDFCACSSRRFVGAFTTTILTDLAPSTALPRLRRLGLHACTTLQAPVFEALLPRLTNLTHLDVGKTLVTDKALLSIAASARISHLDLGRCTRLTGSKVVDFLVTSDAVRDSLVVLNIQADRSRYSLLEDSDLQRLLPNLPPTMRSLNIGGADMRSKHMPLLLPLTKHLEELGLSNADLTASDLNSLFVPRPPSRDDEGGVSEEELMWEPCALRYLDLTSIFSVKQSTLFSSTCVVVSPHSYPLEVVELDDAVVQQLKAKAPTARSMGWTVKELGRRGWFVRLPPSAGSTDDGRRTWKMGARWWGMRKMPVAVQEVGGMYGHYMFKD